MTKTCPNCGAELKDSKRFCMDCGEEAQAPNVNDCAVNNLGEQTANHFDNPTASVKTEAIVKEEAQKIPEGAMKTEQSTRPTDTNDTATCQTNKKSDNQKPIAPKALMDKVEDSALSDIAQKIDKHEIACRAGIVLGIVFLFVGMSIIGGAHVSISAQSVSSITFGADFYTEQYGVTADILSELNSIALGIEQGLNLIIRACGAIICSLGVLTSVLSAERLFAKKQE